MSIVCVGNFNPSIFQPEWFRRHSLLQDSEVDPGQIESFVVSPDITYLVTGDWLNFRCTTQKMVIETTDPSKYYPIGDLTASIFAILDQTPLSSYGFNAHAGYQFFSREVFDGMGHSLAPKDNVWDKVMTRPGLASLAIVDGPHEDDIFRRQIKLDNLFDMVMGVELSENRHFEEENLKKHFELPENSLSIIPAINKFYGDFVDSWEKEFTHILNLAVGSK